jgi:hypothetical protein
VKPRLDMNKIARGLGAERRGQVPVTSGYFGAMQLLADVEARFRVPAGGGRATDPDWTERRLVPLAPRTLKRLEAIAKGVKARCGLSVEPMQLAAVLLEKTTEQLSDDEVNDLVRDSGRRGSEESPAIAWSGRRLRPGKPAGKVRGNRTVADLVIENRK